MRAECERGGHNFDVCREFPSENVHPGCICFFWRPPVVQSWWLLGALGGARVSAGLFVCMYVVYVCRHVCMHVGMHVCMYICMYVGR